MSDPNEWKRFQEENPVIMLNREQSSSNFSQS